MSAASSSESLPPSAPPAGEPIPEALRTNPDYEILRELSRGGMGIVYLVRNRRMDRLECLKVVNGDLLNRPGARERFEQEMRSAAKVNHPHIVAAYSAPALPGLLAFAMEYVDGIDLANLVAANGPLPIANACYYIHQAAKALQCAHDKSLVHRDIKPANLMLGRDGKRDVIKVLDFGLAKATSESPSQGMLTATGQMLGTPQYMAPEQIKDAGSADIRADIYSLGCTLYYLLAGTAPFQNKSGLYEVLHAQQFETPRPINELRPELPAELAGIIAKMTSKDPAHRYQQPAEAAQALAPFFENGIEPISFHGKEAGGAAPASVAVMGLETQTMRARAPAAASPAAPVPIPTILDAAPGHDSQSREPHRMPAANHSREKKGSRSGPRWGRIAALPVLAAIAALWWFRVIDLEPRYGTLDLESNEPHADVYVDGAETSVSWDDEGTKAELQLKTGNRRIEVSKDGFNVASKEVRIKEDQHESFKARLIKLPTFPPSGGAPGDLAATASGNPASSIAGALTASFEGQAAGKARDDNALKIQLHWCPPGEFLMGSPHSEKDRGKDEEQVHVAITHGFWLGRGEVTQGQWTGLMGSAPWKGQSNTQEGPDYPATYITWSDAAAFCAKLTAQERAAGRLAAGWAYLLPTEAQWEYACRAGTKSAYFFGNDALPLAEFGWFKTNTIDAGEKFAHPVNQKRPNPWGLCDVHGNVFEWCRDVFSIKLKGGADPFVPAGGPQYVYRGGGWFTSPSYCRSAIRRGEKPTFTGNALGFRVACVTAAGG